MQLKSVTIHNFRGYRTATTIPIDPNITGITGRNDAGKSSILEALDVFFEGGEVTLDKGDFNVHAKDVPIEIVCTFDDLPDSIIVDDSNHTTLAAEHLLNDEGCLQIKKRYKPSTPTKPLVLIVARHPTSEKRNDLHSLKLADLKKRAADLGVAVESVADGRKSACWRSAIWASDPSPTFGLTELDVAKSLSECKDLYEGIRNALPVFALFRSDRESKDNDPHAKNPLQEAVKQAQAELRTEIESLETKIRSQVIDRARDTIEKLREMDPQLAATLNPRFKNPPKWTFDFTLDGDDDIPINKRGSGVRRLILLNFFRAEAERKLVSTSAPSVIYAIEEPETSQHPSNQEMLVRALLSLSARSTSQIIVTTHVPALAGLLPIDGLRFIEQTAVGIAVSYGTEKVFDRISESLGVLPDKGIAAAKGLLLVEGPSDVTFIRHACEALHGANHISSTLAAKNVCLIAIGGCGNLKHWVTKNLAAQFGIPWAIVIDSDRGTPEEARNQQAIQKYVPHGTSAFVTRKREPENYIHLDVVLPFVQEGSTLTPYTDTCDAKRIIGTATRKRPDDVIDCFWVKMTAEQIREVEKYVDEVGDERHELTELLQSVLAIVK
ncbi:MAG: ATP-dependent endonuclease [Planctomycetales bacterium]